MQIMCRFNVHFNWIFFSLVIPPIEFGVPRINCQPFQNLEVSFFIEIKRGLFNFNKADFIIAFFSNKIRGKNGSCVVICPWNL